MIKFMNYAGTLGVDTQSITQTDVREAVRAWLAGIGYDDWDADDAAGRARIERAWWSDADHFTQPGLADARAIVVVNNLGLHADQHLAEAWSADPGRGAISA